MRMVNLAKKKEKWKEKNTQLHLYTTELNHTVQLDIL